MSKIPFYQIDAFTENIFGGNPAGVCVLDQWLETDVLQKIAAENFLPETAFFIPVSENKFHLRWFTPELEMDLCGHATLATSHVLFNYLGVRGDELRFESRSGELVVSRKGELLTLDFPSRKPTPIATPAVLEAGMKHPPIVCYKSRDYVLVYESEEVVRTLKPDEALLSQLDYGVGGIIATAKGDSVDFVSRFFTPNASIFEDPVTGSAHCSLIPFWAEQLKKTEMVALQVSQRQGKLFCKLEGDRVKISGYCKTYLEGSIYV
jgi:PhzF family phenazine biosynthesis protein